MAEPNGETPVSTGKDAAGTNGKNGGSNGGGLRSLIDPDIEARVQEVRHKDEQDPQGGSARFPDRHRHREHVAPEAREQQEKEEATQKAAATPTVNVVDIGTS